MEPTSFVCCTNFQRNSTRAQQQTLSLLIGHHQDLSLFGTVAAKFEDSHEEKAGFFWCVSPLAAGATV